MIAASLTKTIQEQMCSEIHVRETNHRGISVAMPLIFGDGDTCRVFVREREDGSYLITDGGHVLSLGLMEGVDLLSAGHAGRFRRIVSFYGAEEVGGELQTVVDAANIGDAVFTLIQTCVEAARLTDFPPEAEKRRNEFNKKFQRTVEHELGKSAIQRNWFDPVRDPKHAYRVDYRVGNDEKNYLLFGVGSSGKSWKSIASVQHYRLGQLPGMHSVIAYTESAKADESAFAALAENADHLFSFETERKQFQSFMRREIHAL